MTRVEESSSLLAARLRAASAVQSAIALVLCVALAACWVFAAEQVKPPWQATRPLTATLVALLAVAALLRSVRRTVGFRVAAQALALAVGVLGLLCLGDYFGASGFGRALHEAVFAHVRLSDPRMSPPTCLSLVALAGGLLLLGVRAPQRHCPGQLLCGVAMVISCLALIGHTYGVDQLYQIGNHPSMGVLTSIVVLLLAAAGLCAYPTREPIALLVQENLGGFVARRLVPAAVAFPVLAGWLRLLGQRAGLYTTESGVALFAIANAVFFAWLISAVARRLERIDRERATVVAALHEREERLELVTRATTDAFWDWDLRTKQRWWSESVSILFGYARTDVTGDPQWWSERIHPDERGRVLTGIHAVIDGGGTEWVDEYRFQRADGEYAAVRDHGFVVRDAAGKPLRMAGGVVDVTDYRRAEAAIAKSEALLAAVLEAMPAAIFIVDRAGGLLRANAGAERIFGSPLPTPGSVADYRSFVGWSRETGELLQPEDWPVARALREQRSNTGEILEIQRAGDREHRYVVNSAAPVLDASGELIGGVSASIDVTDRERAVEALRLAKDKAERTQKEQQAILNSMAEGVTVWDARGQLLYLNPAAQMIHGAAAAALQQHSPDRLEEVYVVRDLEGKVVPVEQWPVSRARRGEIFTHYELELEQRADGHRIVGSFGGAPVRDSNGRIVLAVTTLRDITLQHRAETALHEAQAQLRRHAEELEALVAVRTAKLTESVQELERFSYSLSHDLRAPLRAMKGFSQMLQAEFDEQLGETGAMYLNRISAAAGRLDQLIRDVLTYSRIVREAVTLQRVDVEALVSQLVEENPALQEPQASITIRTPLLPVRGHDAYLTQVLSNLLYNAVKFVRRGEKPVVDLWTEETADGVRIFVRDHGIGIPKEVQHRLFGMFERLNRDYEGTGIGLSIVRKAVERMGGSFGVESEEGRGATFWVQLKKG